MIGPIVVLIIIKPLIPIRVLLFRYFDKTVINYVIFEQKLKRWFSLKLRIGSNGMREVLSGYRVRVVFNLLIMTSRVKFRAVFNEDVRWCFNYEHLQG